MSNTFIVLLMVFFHIIDDYNLQGILASMKQKSWWGHTPRQLYRYDYIMALAMHSFSWSFMTMLPIALASNFDVGLKFIFTFTVNAILHGAVDDLKANKKKINLIIDQSIHLLQIAVTAIIFLKV